MSLSRGASERYHSVWRLIGPGREAPERYRWPLLEKVPLTTPGEVRSGVFQPQPLFGLAQIGAEPLDQAAEKLGPIIGTAADATADEPVIVYLPDRRPAGHIIAPEAGDPVDAQAGDLVDDQGEDLRGGSSLALAAACELLGLTRPPENRAEYEKARKRVVNLVNATRRASEEKSRLLSCWRLIQRNSPYQPKFRGTSAAVVTDLSEERSVCNG